MAESIGCKRLVIGMSGASGAIIGIELLRAMRRFAEWETHLVISDGARRTIQLETALPVREVESLATQCHPLDDVGASIASGSFRTEGMVIVPCSMKTLACVANGVALNVLLRAADVTLKERRKLVLVARESPLSLVHLRNLHTAAQQGAVVLPPMMTFYNHPASIEDMTLHVVGKILDVFGLDLPGFSRWNGAGPEPPAGGE